MRQYLRCMYGIMIVVLIPILVSVSIIAQEQKRATYPVVFEVLEQYMCLECHNTEKKEGNVDLSSYEEILKILKPGHANQSLLVHAVSMKMMPALGQAPPLFPEDLDLIEEWINSGVPIKKFKKIRKIFKDYACIDCHRPPKALAGVNLTTYEEVVKWVVPMDPNGSILLNSVKIKSMPLDTNLPRMRPDVLALISEWINSGAPKD